MRSKVSLILVRKNFSSFNFHSIEFFFLCRVDTSYMIHPCVYAAITSCKNLGRIFTSNKSIWSAMFSWRSHFGHFSFLANIFLWNFRQALYLPWLAIWNADFMAATKSALSACTFQKEHDSVFSKCIIKSRPHDHCERRAAIECCWPAATDLACYYISMEFKKR